MENIAGNVRLLSTLSEAVSIGTVLNSHHGQANVIVLPKGEKLEVTGHASMVPALTDGDQVVVLQSHSGAIILDRLRRPDEGPAKTFTVRQDGSILLDNTQGVEITTADAKIAINHSGTVTVNGKTIKSSAKKENILRGGVIRLN